MLAAAVAISAKHGKPRLGRMTIELGMPRLRVGQPGMPGPPGRPAPSALAGAVLPADRPASPALIDRFGRVADDLRVSLTELCNLRCTYCMPAAGLPAAVLGRTTMDRAEVVRIVRIAVESLGVRSVRLTGGEPLLRHDLVEIVRDLAELHPRPELALTTNAVGLASRAAALAAAGLDRINISLDSVRPETFARLARRPLLGRALEGIEAAAAVFDRVKINAVLVRGVNDAEAAELLDWCLHRGFELRFIEQMPLGADRDWQRSQVVTADETRALLSERFDLSPVAEPRAGAPAERWQVRRRGGGQLLGTVGIIASVTEPFCGDCTRTRLTADGAVRNCLFAREDAPLLGLLRAGADDEQIADAWRSAMWAKQAGHGMDAPDFVQPTRTMSEIGG